MLCAMLVPRFARAARRRHGRTMPESGDRRQSPEGRTMTDPTAQGLAAGAPRRHHHADRRCHRQRRQPVACRRRRRRRRHPPRRRTGTAGRMPRRSAAATPATPRSPAAIACRPSTSSTRSARSGAAAATTRTRCSPPATRARWRSPASTALDLDRLPVDLDRRLRLSRRPRRGHRRRDRRRFRRG